MEIPKAAINLEVRGIRRKESHVACRRVGRQDDTTMGEEYYYWRTDTQK